MFGRVMLHIALFISAALLPAQIDPSALEKPFGFVLMVVVYGAISWCAGASVGVLHSKPKED